MELLGRQRFGCWSCQNRIAVHRRIGSRIEEGIERVKFPLRKRIKLVVVTDGALPSQSHEGLHHRSSAIHRVPKEHFLVDRTSLAGRDIAATKTCCHMLIL